MNISRRLISTLSVCQYLSVIFVLRKGSLKEQTAKNRSKSYDNNNH